MKFSITSALLSSIFLAESAFGAALHSHGHRHASLHKRAQGYKLTKATKKQIAANNLLSGINAVGRHTGAAVSIFKGNVTGQSGYFVEYNNMSDDDQTLFVWSAKAGQKPWDAMFPQKSAPDILVTLKKNGPPLMVHFDPSVAGPISGASAAVPASRLSPLNSFGQVDASLHEFTLGGQFSTVDISRLVNMNGSPVTTRTHEYYGHGEATCTSNMTSVAYLCTDPQATSCGMTPTEVKLVNCPNTPYTNCAFDASKSEWNGGCQLLRSDGGFVRVWFGNDGDTDDVMIPTPPRINTAADDSDSDSDS